MISTGARCAMGALWTTILVTAATAATHVVTPDGTGDFPSIQAAIDAAEPGDTILLTSGTFTGEGNRDIDYLGRAITIRSQSGIPATCVIDCQGKGRGFNLISGEGPTSVLEGVTITHGDGGSEGGGGMLCANSSPTLSHCAFVLNTTGQPSGGGGLLLLDSSPILTRCDFLQNSTTGRGSGGAGIYCSGSSPTMTDCVFSENNAGISHGSGLACLNTSSPELIGCVFHANFDGILCAVNSSPTLDRCTLTGNTVSAVYCALGASPVLSNTIIAFNGVGVSCFNNYGGRPVLSCCDVYGNAGGDWNGCIADQGGIDGNIAEDPLFCDLTGGDLTVQGESPCAPEHSGRCGLIGALPVGCGATAVEPTTWGSIKASLR